MESKETTLFGLLDGSKHYVIPHFQRLYSWDLQNCERLFHDVERLVADPDSTHFIGSVVYVSHPAKADGVNEFVVIDGQQRLTTLSLTLLALISEMHLDDESRSKRLNRTLRNADEQVSVAQYLKLRLTRNDDDSYKQIVFGVANGIELETNLSKIHRNFSFLVELVRSSSYSAEQLWEAATRLDMVYISLSAGRDEPQSIFESLNSTGKNLTSTDLIRNFVLMDQPQSDQERLYDGYWAKIESRFSDRKDTEFDEFTRVHLAHELRRYPKKTAVYESFKEWVVSQKNGNASHDEILQKFLTASKTYAYLLWENEENEATRKALEDFRNVGLRLLNPILLGFTNKFTETNFDSKSLRDALALLESYLIRRVMCGLRSNALDNIMASIYSNMEKSAYTGTDALADAILSLRGKARFPLNSEFLTKGKEFDLYNSVNREHILKKIERQLDPNGIGLSAKLTIEHVMPQKLTKEWERELGADAISIRDKYVHTIGNLTLTPYNSALGQKTLKQKQEMTPGGFRDSKVRISDSILSAASWGESEIKNRAAELMKLAAKAWPEPKIYGPSYKQIGTAVAFEDLELQDLMAAELVTADDEIVWQHSGELHRARITEAGTVVVADGEEYQSLTAATKHFTTANYNGWDAWKLGANDGPTLNDIRKNLAAGD